MIVQTLNPDTTNWLQTSLTANTSYSYYVKAYNVKGVSLTSGATLWYTFADVPSGLQTNVVNISSVTATWSGNGTQYDIIIAQDQNFTSGVSTKTLTATTTDFLSLTDYTTYWFRVRAYNGDGVTTDYDGPISTRTVFDSPTLFAGVVLSLSLIHI